MTPRQMPRPHPPARVGARGITLIEVLVAVACLAVLLLSTLALSRTNRELSRHRMVRLAALRDLELVLDLVAVQEPGELRRLPAELAGPIPASWQAFLEPRSPLEAFLARGGVAPLDRRAVSENLLVPVLVRRLVSFQPDTGRPGLHLLKVSVLYKLAPEDDWSSVSGARLVRTDS